ncbi:MAG: cytochrome c [Chloroflexota bacterium]
MSPKALLIMLVLFALVLPILSTDHFAAQHPAATVTSAAVATVEATAETDAAPEPTVEATLALTAEVTLEPAAETTLEPVSAALTGDPVRGDMIFHNGLNAAPACVNCHSTTSTGKQGFAIGPGLKGIGEFGGTRVERLTATQYIEESIRHPHDYIVGGFRDIMYPSFDADYSDQNIADLVAYLLTLES